MYAGAGDMKMHKHVSKGALLYAVGGKLTC